MPNIQTAIIGIFLLYVLILLGSLLFLNQTRKNVIRQFSSESSVKAWERWQESVEEQRTNPRRTVSRRPVKSDEPPLLVLMRDHFAICTVALCVVGSVIYGTIAFLIFGVCYGSRRQHDFPGAKEETPQSTDD